MPAAGSPAGEESGARLEEAWLILVKCTGQQYKCKLGPLGASPAVVYGFLPGPDSGEGRLFCCFLVPPGSDCNTDGRSLCLGL